MQAPSYFAMQVKTFPWLFYTLKPNKTIIFKTNIHELKVF